MHTLFLLSMKWLVKVDTFGRYLQNRQLYPFYSSRFQIPIQRLLRNSATPYLPWLATPYLEGLGSGCDNLAQLWLVRNHLTADQTGVPFSFKARIGGVQTTSALFTPQTPRQRPPTQEL